MDYCKKDETKMKIDLIGTLPPIKALSPYCFHLATALSEKVDLDFISFKSIIPDFLYGGGTKDNRDKDYKLKNAKTRSILNFYNPFTWLKTGIKLRGDVIHAQHWALYSTLTYCIILSIAKIKRKKIVLTIHNILPHNRNTILVVLDKILNKIIFSFVDNYIVHNVRNKERLIEIYKINPDKIFIITHGIIYPYSKLKRVNKIQARKKLDIPIDKKVILFFGYIWDYKGLDVLLESLAILKRTIKDLKLIIAGQALRDWHKYKKIIFENDLNKNIIYKLEYIPDSDIEYYFTSSDLVVLPYKKRNFETHGGVGAIAIAFDKPLIVTDVGGLPEYVKEKKVISKPDNAQDLAEKINLVLKDKNLMDKLSNDSKKLAKELSWDKIADETIDVYKKTLLK